LATNVPTVGSGAGSGHHHHQQQHHHFEVDMSYISSKVIGMIQIFFNEFQ
jgi:hypothetical protein